MPAPDLERLKIQMDALDDAWIEILSRRKAMASIARQALGDDATSLQTDRMAYARQKAKQLNLDPDMIEGIMRALINEPGG